MSVHGLTRFSTGNLPQSLRLAGWEGHNARSLVGLSARPLHGRPFAGTEVNLRLPRVQLARVSGSPHVVERNARRIAAEPAEGVVVYFPLSGHSEFFHRGGCLPLFPGQGVVCDADQPFRRVFPRGLTELVLKAPRAVFREATGRSGLPGPRVFDFRDPVHARALASSVATALRGGQADWETLESTTLALLGAVLGAEVPAGGRLAAAHGYIAAHLGEPDLSASRIAAAIGYSERQLSRLFAESGQSVPQAVLAARLDAVRRALAEPAGARTTLAELAGRCGFASQAHFSRTYRTRFGVTPLQDRRELPGRRLLPVSAVPGRPTPHGALGCHGVPQRTGDAAGAAEEEQQAW